MFRHTLHLVAFACVISISSGLLQADGPTLKRLFPAGAQRGSSVAVAALGDAPKWPVQVWCDHPGIKWEPLSDKGKFRVSVDGSVPLGKHFVRFYDSDNSTDALGFFIGAVGEINEQEPNNGLGKAQAVSDLPRLINGVLEKRSEVDTYAVDLTEGQTLIATVDAQQGLRSPMDATLQIVSARGSVLSQNLDTVGLDPRIVFTAPKTGRYQVRVFAFPETPDSTISFAGGENFVYRLSLAHAGLLRATRPLAVSATEETQLELVGVGLPVTSTTVSVPSEHKASVWPLAVEGAINALSLPVLKTKLLVEQPSSGGNVQRLSLPCSLTGTLDQPQQIDRYRFAAKKDTKLRIELQSRALGYPMDGVFKILDAAGKQLAREDDARRDLDAKSVWQPPADGEYTLEVSDAYGAGGLDWLYRLDMHPLEGSVDLSVKADHFQGKVGSAVDIAVSIDRRDGFAQPLQIRVSGLPDTVQCPEVVSEKDGETAKAVTLKLTASAPFSGPLRIVATVKNDSEFHRTATAASEPLLTDIWLTVKP